MTEGVITGLRPFTQYVVFVSSENGVSAQDSDINGRTVSVNITTLEGDEFCSCEFVGSEFMWCEYRHSQKRNVVMTKSLLFNCINKQMNNAPESWLGISLVHCTFQGPVQLHGVSSMNV